MKRVQGLAPLPTIMPEMSKTHSSAPASLSTYVKPSQSGAWKWPAYNSTPMQCGSQPLVLEEYRAFQSPGNPSSILNRPPPTRLPILITCWRDTFVLCLTWVILQHRGPSAQKTTPKPLVLGVASTQHTINHTSKPAPLGLELHLHAEKILVILLTFALADTLRFSSSLSLWFSSPQGCIGHGPYAGLVSFLHLLEIPTCALPRGLFSLNVFRSPEANLPHAPPLQTLSSWPIRS